MAAMSGTSAHITAEGMEYLEGALGFYPYGDESNIEVSSGGDFVVPDDIRVRLLSKLSISGALNAEDTQHVQALRNLEQHTVESLEGSQLYDYQQEVVRSIKGFLQYPEYDESGSPVRHGYIKLPTATGKTAIYAHTVSEITKQVGNATKPLKTLVLVPGRDLVGQVVGTQSEQEDMETEEIVRGFAKFAPEMKVTEYHGGKKDLSGDVVVMTYQSLNVAVQNSHFNANDFGVIVGDEIHRALGPTTRQSIKRVMDDKIAIGFSATTEYAPNKTVMDLMPTEIYRLELRDAVEKGYLAPIRAIAIATNDKLCASGVGEFKDPELATLIDSEWRNKTAINIARDFVAKGQQVLVTCLPGQDLRHAREMADRLSLESVIDHDTGITRNVRAQMVHGGMKVAERREVYALYENGEIDILTSVDLLNEGWDSEQAKVLINLRPTTSPVLGVQRLGRILRPTVDGLPATVVEFIDEIEKPGKAIFTFYHAMGEKEVNQDKVYGHSTRTGVAGGDVLPSPELPDDLKKLIAIIDHRILDQRIFGNIIDLARRDFQTKNSLGEQLGVARQTIGRVAGILGILGVAKLTTEGKMKHIYYSPEEKESIIKYLEENTPAKAPDTYKVAQAIGDEIGVGRDIVLSIAEKLGIEGDVFKFGATAGTGYSPEDQQRIANYVRESAAPLQSEGYVSTNTLAKQNGFKYERIRALVSLLDIEPMPMRSRVNNNVFLYLSPDDQQQILDFIKENGLPRVQSKGNSFYGISQSKSPLERFETDEYVSMTTIAELTGWSQAKVAQLVKKMGNIGTDVIINGGLAKGFDYEERASLVSQLGEAPIVATEENFSATGLARQLGVKAIKITELAQKMGIEGQTMRFGAQITTGYNREEQERIAAQVEALFIPDASEDSLSAQGIKLFIGDIGYREVVKGIKELGIEGKLMKFKGKPGLGFTPAEQQAIVEHLTKDRPPRAPEGFLSMPGLSKSSGLSMTKIKKAVQQLGLGAPMRFRSLTTTGLSQEEQQVVIELIDNA